MNKQPKSKLDEIKCPECGTLIPVSDALQHQIQEEIEKESRHKIEAKEGEMQAREKKLEEKEKSIAKSQKEIDKQVEQGIKAERVKIEKEVKEQVKADVALELQDAKNQLAEKDERLKEAQEAELKLRKQTRELEERKKAFELEMTRKLDKEREAIKEEATKVVLEEYHLRDAEKDKKLQDAIKANEELRRKLQQGSQQSQGEVLELELEELLRANFPLDQIEPVPKGVNGADVIQKIYSQAGQYCGTIVWESKRTKSWSDGWISKLKDDQREVRADIAILISEALPKDIKSFAFKSGVWVADYSSILGLATAVRMNIMQVAVTKSSIVGKNEKMEVIYNYLLGPEFRQKVEAIVESFIAMQKDLHDEKRAFVKRWAQREKQIERVINNTSGMYGDLQGLIGSSMGSIPALEAGREDEVGDAELSNKPKKDGEKDQKKNR